MKAISKFCSALFVVGISAGLAGAGELRKDTDVPGCDYVYSGEVSEGDADKIESLIPATASGRRLCLSSPGGDFIEGLKMFHAIWNKDSIETYVRSGDGCYSACALAFMGGSRVVGTGAIRSRARIIEPGARLGFHAPRLVLDEDEMLPSSLVGSAYARALRGAGHLFDLTKKVEHGARGMTDFLFKRTIETPPEEMFEIDTIGKASLAEISVATVPFAKISWEAMRNVCDTAFIKSDGYFSGTPTAKRAFGAFSDTGTDGTGRPIALEDRVWSWRDGNFSYFVIRGYAAPHKNEAFCRVSLSRFAWDRETALPTYERDPTTQAFAVTLWQDAYVPRDSSFAAYAENNKKSYEQVAVPWSAMWDPMTPLTRFAR